MSPADAIRTLRTLPPNKIDAHFFSLTEKDSAKKASLATLAAAINRTFAREDVLVIVAQIPKSKAEAIRQ